MNMEYAVQTLTLDEWEVVGIYPTYDVAKFERDRRIEDFGGNHRIACREVGDWCECREGKKRLEEKGVFHA